MRPAALLLQLALLTALLLAGGHARAEVSARDLQVMARALGFMEPPYTGTVRMGIVYDPDNVRSSQQAEAVQRLAQSGLGAGNIELRTVMLPLSEVNGSRVDVFLLTESMGEAAADFRKMRDDNSIPCVTTDLSQVRDGNCLMGIQSSPRVQIQVNRNLAEASDTRFASVFRMMIVEL